MMITKKLLIMLAFISVNISADVVAVADENGEDFYKCAEIQYGTGREIGGGCREMDITVLSKCQNRFHVTANFSYEGTDVGGNICGGSEEGRPVMWVSPKETRTGTVSACKCWKTTRAWIDDVILKRNFGSRELH